MWKREEFSVLLGKTLKSIANNNNEQLVFVLENGDQYRLYHNQDCCECVLIEDICGDFYDLIGTPILLAEEASNSEEFQYKSYTWTFYKLATINGYVTIRWLGTSNGEYSERVEFEKYND